MICLPAAGPPLRRASSPGGSTAGLNSLFKEVYKLNIIRLKKASRFMTSDSSPVLINRETRETSITAAFNLRGGAVDIETGVGFFDHMLTAFIRHGGFGLTLKAQGDTQVDDHHTVEDCGLVLGEAWARALGDYTGHARFGWALLPMDEALAEAAVDLARRPCLVFKVDWPGGFSGRFELALIEEFWRAFSQKAGAALHLIGRYGRNSHHLAEALFKAAGLALAQASAARPGGAVSTKGRL